MKNIAVALCLFSVSLLAADPVKGVLTNEDNNYALEFTLEDGGSLTLVTNADKDLKDGVEIEFARQGKRLRVQIIEDHIYDVSGHFVFTDPTKTLKMDIDVHAHGHIIVRGVDEGDGEFSFKKRVLGKHWTVKTNKANVTKAKQGEARHKH